MTDQNKNLIQAKEELKNVLIGYGRHRHQELKALIEFKGWQKNAQLAIEQRTMRILASLNIETLTFLANGDLNFSEIANKIYQEIDKHNND